MPILLYSTDNTTVITEGQISQYSRDQAYDGINISLTWTVIDITKVLVPGAIVTTHWQRSLSSFGQTPFSVICLHSHLQIFDPTTSSTMDSDLVISAPSMGYNSLASSAANSSQAATEIVEERIENEGSSVGDLLSQDLSDNTQEPSLPRDIDHSSLSLGSEILGQDPEVWDYTIHSHVLKDVWHVFHMFYISATHGLQKQFT
ncbi:hypothetical protein CPB84DRAFT_1749865 [Gymnopilus junonius]|uniref:Uncharacterized protein n=1 Tax=Gymnopilus junonius TaxID=109634 RepID=A0A9P5TJ41_GYMJU|nr:hypothetical protein CPB84DRAFT_1749865 [Gymnopilus junonius]